LGHWLQAAERKRTTNKRERLVQEYKQSTLLAIHVLDSPETWNIGLCDLGTGLMLVKSRSSFIWECTGQLNIRESSIASVRTHALDSTCILAK
jgi:hypothetical protein